MDFTLPHGLTLGRGRGQQRRQRQEQEQRQRQPRQSPAPHLDAVAAAVLGVVEARCVVGGLVPVIGRAAGASTSAAVEEAQSAFAEEQAAVEEPKAAVEHVPGGAAPGRGRDDVEAAHVELGEQVGHARGGGGLDFLRINSRDILKKLTSGILLCVLHLDAQDHWVRLQGGWVSRSRGRGRDRSSSSSSSSSSSRSRSRSWSRSRSSSRPPAVP